MKKKMKWLWISILAIILIIQFIPFEKPIVVADNPDDLITNNIIPDDIANMLKQSCYDCHSNETIYPWYSKIAPVKWLVYNDIKEGREHLNFSDWQSIKKIDKASALDDISEVVTNGEMPMKIYTIMHTKAKLSKENRNAISDWANDFADKLFE